MPSLIYFFYLYMTIRPKFGVTRPLQSYPYISYTIFIEALLLYFVRYINGYMKSYPFREFSHFYPCFVIRKFFHARNLFQRYFFREIFLYLLHSDFFLAKVSTFKVYLRPLAKNYNHFIAHRNHCG